MEGDSEQSSPRDRSLLHLVSHFTSGLNFVAKCFEAVTTQIFSVLFLVSYENPGNLFVVLAECSLCFVVLSMVAVVELYHCGLHVRIILTEKIHGPRRKK